MIDNVTESRRSKEYEHKEMWNLVKSIMEANNVKEANYEGVDLLVGSHRAVPPVNDDDEAKS